MRPMTREQLRELLNAQPFRPFAIGLADGRQVRVENSEFAILSPSGRTVIVYQRDDSFQIVDLMLVTSLDVPGEQKRSA